MEVAWAELVRRRVDCFGIAQRLTGAAAGKITRLNRDCAQARFGALQFARVMPEQSGRRGEGMPNSFFCEGVTLE